ncbi:MAG TPA: hypothetical protein VHM90_05695 [Phycisphaerae bacterium]|nr:hypothetical protein [Phycisphaerae bacterium]
MTASQKYIGKHVLVGLTYTDADGNVVSQAQLHGKITRITDAGIFFNQADGSGEFSLPPDITSLQPAKPGIYRLRATGEEIHNPDFVSVWTIKAPPDA